MADIEAIRYCKYIPTTLRSNREHINKNFKAVSILGPYSRFKLRIWPQVLAEQVEEEDF